MTFVLVNIQISFKMNIKYKATLSVVVIVYFRCIVTIVGVAKVQETLS
ncbi:unnamed protein product [Acanthoscelides obtectus]|uniref:Uncharacterized protein n=1 Tax=Acanthoscelides obtectus TaxID=200917 RepID=A0A9P0KSA0_ACAOB|nr:unnamed protein product [Acanthoscelides obtectus]CAK1628605.1 hypothetical protein AOBTE_LOCUS5301 [Acanthoscelides obtectus]